MFIKTVWGIAMVNSIKTNSLNVKDEYKRIIDSLTKEPHCVDRDGDLFNIVCPVCGSINTGRIGIFFICAKRHIFWLYTEDGVRKISDLSDDRKKRILGNDLDPRTLMDSHGHEKYKVFQRDQKVSVYYMLSLWGLDYDNTTLENVKIYLDMFKDKMGVFGSKFGSMSLYLYNFYTDFDSSLNGKAGNYIISKNFPLWMEKAIVIANEIDNMSFGNEEIYANLFYID